MGSTSRPAKQIQEFQSPPERSLLCRRTPVGSPASQPVIPRYMTSPARANMAPSVNLNLKQLHGRGDGR